MRGASGWDVERRKRDLNRQGWELPCLSQDSGNVFEREAASQEPGRSNPCHRLWAEDKSAASVLSTRLSGYLLLSSLLSLLLLNSKPLGESYLIVSGLCSADDFSCGCS